MKFSTPPTKKIKSLFLILFASLIILFLQMPLEPVNAFECCVTADKDNHPTDVYPCLSMGEDYQVLPCPGSSLYCWQIIKWNCKRNLCCSYPCGPITEPVLCRARCEWPTGRWIKFGCGSQLVSKWDEWDMNDLRNAIRGCYCMTCFCEEDICQGIARRQLDTDNCSDKPCVSAQP